MKKKYNKYHNVKKNGYDSTAEYERSLVLKEMENKWEISELKEQISFVLQPPFVNSKGEKIRDIRYIADFTYYIGDKYIVEDVKSPISCTPSYKIKKKMLEYKFPEVFFNEYMIWKKSKKKSPSTD